MKLVLVHSPLGGSLKTTSIYVLGYLASCVFGKKVLLVDLDLQGATLEVIASALGRRVPSIWPRVRTKTFKEVYEEIKEEIRRGDARLDCPEFNMVALAGGEHRDLYERLEQGAGTVRTWVYAMFDVIAGLQRDLGFDIVLSDMGTGVSFQMFFVESIVRRLAEGAREVHFLEFLRVDEISVRRAKRVLNLLKGKYTMTASAARASGASVYHGWVAVMLPRSIYSRLRSGKTDDKIIPELRGIISKAFSDWVTLGGGEPLALIPLVEELLGPGNHLATLHEWIKKVKGDNKLWPRVAQPDEKDKHVPAPYQEVTRLIAELLRDISAVNPLLLTALEYYALLSIIWG